MNTTPCIPSTAFLLSGGNRWLGGYNYQINAIRILRQYAPALAIHTLCSATIAELVSETEISAHSVPMLTGMALWGNRCARRLTNHDWPIEQLLKRNSVQVVFSNNPYLGRSVPALFWIPDFQHRRLPEMFSKAERQERERAFKLGSRSAQYVIVTSRDVLADFQNYIPEQAWKVRLLDSVVFADKHIYEIAPEQVVARYHLPDRFVYFPGQFWQHKNHAVVFDALRILAKNGMPVNLVCTGNKEDYRHPDYYGQLMHKAVSSGINDQLFVLGIVPKSDVNQLIRQSVCVINPSLFEGWSTTVEEAQSIGKQVILSDIMVHREKDIPDSILFDPYSAKDLADKLGALWAEAPSGADLVREDLARHILPQRMQRFTEQFVSIVCSCL